MTHDELNQNFDGLKDALKAAMSQQPASDDQKMQAAVLVLGLDLLQSALGDLKRVADAMESIASEELHRIASSLESLEENDDKRLDWKKDDRIHEGK